MPLLAQLDDLDRFDRGRGHTMLWGLAAILALGASEAVGGCLIELGNGSALLACVGRHAGIGRRGGRGALYRAVRSVLLPN